MICASAQKVPPLKSPRTYCWPRFLRAAHASQPGDGLVSRGQSARRSVGFLALRQHHSLQSGSSRVAGPRRLAAAPMNRVTTACGWSDHFLNPFQHLRMRRFGDQEDHARLLILGQGLEPLNEHDAANLLLHVAPAVPMACEMPAPSWR